MMQFVDPIREFFLAFGILGALVWIVLKILLIAVPVILAVAFYVVWERKLIGWMHVRHGPMYIGKGILQAFADVFKLLFKEVVQPTVAQPFLFRLAPLIALVPAFAAWAVVPFDSQLVLSNANAGLLYLLAMTSLGVYGIILAGWMTSLNSSLNTSANACSTPRPTYIGPWRTCIQPISLRSQTT